jgi:hypothetical protein
MLNPDEKHRDDLITQFFFGVGFVLAAAVILLHVMLG